MDKSRNLPILGVGPIYFTVVALLTIVGMYLSRSNDFIKRGSVEYLKMPFYYFSILLIVFGLMLYFKATVQDKITDHIRKNLLVTNGIYAFVRNPMYSAIGFICTGVLLLQCNFYLLILPLIFWGYMTVLLKYTEERWLLNKFGYQYESYCKRVNRCIPWFPPRKKNFVNTQIIHHKHSRKR